MSAGDPTLGRSQSGTPAQPPQPHHRSLLRNHTTGLGCTRQGVTATADTGIASALTGVLGGMDLGGWLRSARSGSPSADRYGSRLPRDSTGLLAWDACLPLPHLRVRLSHEFVSCSVSLGGLQADRGVWNRPSSVHTPRNAVSAPLRLFPLNPYKLSRSCGSSV